DDLVTGVQTCALPICARRSDALGQISRGFQLKTVLLKLAASKRLNHGDGTENLVHAGGNPAFLLALPADRSPELLIQPGKGDKRSEERRVGKGWRSR